MTEQAQEQKTLTINWTQIAGGALAAVTSAVLLAGLRSLGTYGTLVGAAVGSIAASTAAAIYSHYLSASRDRVLEAARRARRTPPAPGQDPDDDLPVIDRTTPDHAGDPAPGDPVPPQRKWRARHSILLGIIAFVVAVGGIATYEVVTGSSVSAQVQGTTSSDDGVSSGILGNPITEAPATPVVTDTPTDPSDTATSTSTGSPTDTATTDATATATETSATDDATATGGSTATSDSTATSEATAESDTGSTATQSADGSGGAAGELSTPGAGTTATP